MRVKLSGEGPKTGNNLRHPVAATIGNPGGGGGGAVYVPFQVKYKDEGDIARDVITSTDRKDRED